MAERREKGVLAMFGEIMSFSLVNMGRLLLWALPVPLYGLALTIFAPDEPPSEESLPSDPSGLQSSAEGGATLDATSQIPSLVPTPEALGLLLLGFLVVVPLQFGIQRHLLTGAPLGRPPYLLLYTSRMVWRYAALLLGIALATLALYAAGASLFSMAVVADPVGGQPPTFSVLPMVGSIALLTLTVFVAFRMFVASSLLARGDAHPIRGSWDATRGGLLRVLALSLLTMFVYTVAAAPISVLLHEPGGPNPVSVIVMEIFSFFWVVVAAAMPCVFLRAREAEAKAPRLADGREEEE